MLVVTIFIKKNHSACEQAVQDLKNLQEVIPHQLAVVDIETDESLRSSYQDIVPVVQVGPYRLKAPFTQQDLQVAIGAARDRSQHLDQIGDVSYDRRIKRGRSVSSADRISFWLGHHYMGLIIFVLALYVGLPFLAPLLARAGAQVPARVLYTIYSPLCHQLTYRSWFIFGNQPYYPRELANISGVPTYETFFLAEPSNLEYARKFIGNEEIGAGKGQIGYKVALCQRDVAIYGALLLFGIFFTLTGRRIKTLPWYFWVIFGLVPIGIDGVSQLPSLLEFLPDWLLMRESTPVLRSITGCLFGLTTAWYLFPMIEESMRETRSLLAGKMAVVPQIEAGD